MTRAAILLLILAAFGKPAARMDIWERNHLLNDQGQETLDQVILWRMRKVDQTQDYFCVDWKMSNKCRQPERINGQWRGTFDGREVVATLARESWTLYDPELADRERLPAAKRGGL